MKDILKIQSGNYPVVKTIFPFLILLTIFGAAVAAQIIPQNVDASATSWTFAVSGDSRNCGDVVMPAIAAGAAAHRARFYWHLGDFRKISDFDEDMLSARTASAQPALSIYQYERTAWDDFLAKQIRPFGTMPVFLGIGNHETVPPKNRGEYIAQFADWLDAPVIREQRLADDPAGHKLKTYFHWIKDGIDFITLDNATPDQFDSEQMKWFTNLITRDESNHSIGSIVVGMHAALPYSIAYGHSMNDWPQGEQSGVQVYKALLHARDSSHKNVYILASHSHFFMDGIFNTEYWKQHGGVLPGWIVGTAGAQRYRLPSGSEKAQQALTHVYGYLLGTLQPDGAIQFKYQLLQKSDLVNANVNHFPLQLIDECFVKNSEQ